MKIIATVVAAVFAFTLAGCSSGGGSVQTVDAQQFLSQSQKPGTTVIDVRTPAEYAAGHVAGAINMDVEAPGFDAQVGALDKSASYEVYCHSGRRSQLAADRMTQAGFTSVTNLQGGIADLQAAGAQITA